MSGCHAPEGDCGSRRSGAQVGAGPRLPGSRGGEALVARGGGARTRGAWDRADATPDSPVAVPAPGAGRQTL